MSRIRFFFFFFFFFLAFCFWSFVCVLFFLLFSSGSVFAFVNLLCHDEKFSSFRAFACVCLCVEFSVFFPPLSRDGESFEGDQAELLCCVVLD